MKNLLFTLSVLLLSYLSGFTQISKGGIPESFKHELKSPADRLVIHPHSPAFIVSEDSKMPKDGKPPRIGYSIYTDISLKNSGTWSEIEGKGKLWQLQIKSPGALAVGLYFDKFNLPYGSKLFVYNEDKTQVIGAFTSENNHSSGLFATEMIYGDLINLEYFESEDVASSREFHINEIMYFYRGVKIIKNTSWTEPSEPCQININCSPVGDNWQDEKRGVARMSVKIGGDSYLCTGSLVNNTNQDCTPYFLSAYHCYEGASASDLNQWIFYFNYEASGCTTPSIEPSSNSMTGCTLKSSGNIVGGSDFILLQLSQSVPQNYNPYMNGWDRSNSVSGPGVGIHHPSGSIKKISTYNSGTTDTWSNGASNAYWKLQWVSNSNGWGVTEGGSSGSPLFDSNGRITGTLTGGSSNCTAQSDPDYYGKLYYHWDLNGSGASSRLKDWLDPSGSNPVTLNGKNCPSGTPTCDSVELMSTGAYWISYANGNNQYNDRAKVNYYASTNNTKTVKDVYVYFIYATGSGNAAVAVWDNSGVSGSPGSSPLATTNLPISTIISNVNNSQYSHFSFSSPVSLSGPCYIGVILPTAAGDTVVILADTSSSPGYNVAWEKWSDDTWYPYNDPSSWGKNAALDITPIICSGTGISEISLINPLVFPNPAFDIVYLLVPETGIEEFDITISDIYGRVCKKTNIKTGDNSPAQIGLSGLNNGIYFLRGESRKGSFTKKIMILNR